jgi:hypothetical protein
MTNLATGQPEANLSTRGKKVGLSGREFYNGNSGIEIFWAWSACTTGFLQGNIRD